MRRSTGFFSNACLQPFRNDRAVVYTYAENPVQNGSVFDENQNDFSGAVFPVFFPLRINCHASFSSKEHRTGMKIGLLRRRFDDCSSPLTGNRHAYPLWGYAHSASFHPYFIVFLRLRSAPLRPTGNTRYPARRRDRHTGHRIDTGRRIFPPAWTVPRPAQIF